MFDHTSDFECHGLMVTPTYFITPKYNLAIGENIVNINKD